MTDRDEVERWKRIEPLLDRALDLEAAERERFLAELEREDAALRRELERYLEADAGPVLVDLPLHRVAGDLVERLPLDRLDSVVAPGSRVGPYRILRELGEGGMSRVYLAERADGQYVQRVALKILTRSNLRRGDLRVRFLRERQILADLKHDGIARLLDGGVTKDGRPYFVLEYIEGDGFIEYCDRQELSLEDRLRLFLKLCDAVAYAHSRGVVHRDLKPSNLLVEAREGQEARVCVLDFGIAREDRGDELTLTGQVVGTPGYMAPEQARGRRHEVGARSDVFSLGVVLYRLLCGRAPFVGATPAEALVRLIDEEPQPLRELNPKVAPDLERIVLRCLRKRPAERYESVRTLADELERFLEGRTLELDTASLDEVEEGVGGRRWTLAVGGLVATVLLALGLGWHESRQQAAAAARLGELEERGESLLRSVQALHLAKVHDLSPERRRLEADLGALRELAERQPTSAIAATADRIAGEFWQRLGEPDRAAPYLVAALASHGAGEARRRAAEALFLAAADALVYENALRLLASSARARSLGLAEEERRISLAELVSGPVLAVVERSAGADGAPDVLTYFRLLRDGRAAQAEDVARRIVESRPDRYEAWLLLGDAALADAAGSGNYERRADAAQAYALASAQGESDPRVFERLCLLELERLASDDVPSQGWRAPCEQAEQLDALREEAQVLRAIGEALWALESRGRQADWQSGFERSRGAVVSARWLDPQSALPLRALAGIEMVAYSAGSRDAAGRAVEALEAAQRTLESAGESPWAARTRASLLRSRGIALVLRSRQETGLAERTSLELAIDSLRSAATVRAEAAGVWLDLALARAERARAEVGVSSGARRWLDRAFESLQAGELAGARPDAVATTRALLQVSEEEVAARTGVASASAAAAVRTLAGGAAGAERSAGASAAEARAWLALAEEVALSGEVGEARSALVRARHLVEALSPGWARDALRARYVAVGSAVNTRSTGAEGLAGLRQLRRVGARWLEDGATPELRLAISRVELALAERGSREEASSWLESAETSARRAVGERDGPETQHHLARVLLARAARTASSQDAERILVEAIDSALRARADRAWWPELEETLADLHGLLAERRTGAERTQAERHAAQFRRRALELRRQLAASGSVTEE